MAFILGSPRDQDRGQAFREYERYLHAHRERFPPSAWALATADWYFNFQDHRCPHDAWLESVSISEPATGTRREVRTCQLTVRLLGAFHDGSIEFHYPDVRSYRLEMPDVGKGHGDWHYDEFRVDDEGLLIHEIEWAGGNGSWLIKASDVHFRWMPTVRQASE